MKGIIDRIGRRLGRLMSDTRWQIGDNIMKAVIDRIEEGIAVLVIDWKTINLPVEVFGFKVHEGQHLKITFEPDEKSEQETREKIKNLQEELLNRNKDNGEAKD